MNQTINRTLLLFSATLVIIACSHNANDESQHELNTTVKLENGKKWKANPETIKHVNAMANIIASNPNAVDKNYSSIAKQLLIELKLVFDECTMTGEAHEQLHNFLIPLHKNISKLIQNKSEHPAETLAEIETHLSSFGDYFE